MGHIAHEVRAHQFEFVHLRDIAHQHQTFAFAEQRDLKLQHLLLVAGRGDAQRLGVLAFFEVVDEARFAQQVGDALLLILCGAKAQQCFGSLVPPGQIALGIDHHYSHFQRRRGFLGLVQNALEKLHRVALAALQTVDAVEDLAPYARALRRLLAVIVGKIAQPALEDEQLIEGVCQVAQNGQNHDGGDGAHQGADKPGGRQHDQYTLDFYLPFAEQCTIPVGQPSCASL